MKLARNISQVKIGAAFAYILIIANALYGFFVTPFILSMLGNSSYGVYKTIASLSSSMLVLDLGIGSTVMRYVAKYRADDDKERIQSFFSMALCEAGILIGFVLIVIVGIYFSIEKVYQGNFTGEELALAQELFVVLSINIVFHILENVINGVITGYNDFFFGNGFKLVRFAVRLCLIYILITIFRNALILAYIDLGITVVSVICEMLYVRKKFAIAFRFAFRTEDIAVFKESFVYTILMFLTSIAAQINGNLDNVVIGAIRGPELVTIYSFGLVIFGMFEQLSMSIAGVMLPTITNALKIDDQGRTLQRIIVKVGRVQFMLLGAAVVGFATIGKQFIDNWLGPGFEDVYIIALILMVPSTFELCVNVCLSVLRAKNKIGFRTAVLSVSTILNLFVTIIGVKYWDYKAAAVGTALSFTVGSLIVMNVYYYKTLGFNMLRIYKEILKGIWLCLAVGGIAITGSARIFTTGWGGFAVNVVIFCVVYGLCLLLFGLNNEEKKHIPFLKADNIIKVILWGK